MHKNTLYQNHMVYSVKNYTWLKDWLELLPDSNKKGIPLEVVLIINYFLLRSGESFKEFRCCFHNALKFSNFFNHRLFFQWTSEQ